MLLAWSAWHGGESSAFVARIADGTLSTGFGAVRDLGSRVRDVNGIAPLFLPDGRAAVAWTDNDTPEAYLPGAKGRLHLAVDGAAPSASPPPPRVTLRVRRVQRLFAPSRSRASVSCDRPCDVRMYIARGLRPRTLTLPSGRTAEVKLGLLIEDLRAREVRLRVHASAAGGTQVARQSVPVRVFAARRCRCRDRSTSALAGTATRSSCGGARRSRPAAPCSWWRASAARAGRSSRATAGTGAWSAAAAGPSSPPGSGRGAGCAGSGSSREDDGGRAPKPVVVRVD